MLKYVVITPCSVVSEYQRTMEGQIVSFFSVDSGDVFHLNCGGAPLLLLLHSVIIVTSLI
jgi:hypothetical protein